MSPSLSQVKRGLEKKYVMKWRRVMSANPTAWKNIMKRGFKD